MSSAHRCLTKEELSRYDGRDGAPALVACQGLVYEVSGSFQWRNGKHQVVHFAGCDHTASLRGAPHGEDLLLRFPVVGILVEDVVAGPLESGESTSVQVRPSGGRSPRSAG